VFVGVNPPPSSFERQRTVLETARRWLPPEAVTSSLPWTEWKPIKPKVCDTEQPTARDCLLRALDQHKVSSVAETAWSSTHQLEGWRGTYQRAQCVPQSTYRSKELSLVAGMARWGALPPPPRKTAATRGSFHPRPNLGQRPDLKQRL
jgi:hypothetical protein